MKHLLACLCLALVLPLRGEAADWEGQLTAGPGPIPLSRPYTADYDIGWSGVSAGEARVRIGDRKGAQIFVQASGRSTGFARALWRLDATHTARADADSLTPREAKQREVYRGKTLETSLEFSGKTVQRTRQAIPQDKAPSTKRWTYPDPLDLFSAFLQVRSQPLKRGDTYRFVVFPSTSAYLATVKVAGKERVKVEAGSFNAIKCELSLQRIGKKNKLEQHSKFKRAFAWISDDSDRFVVKVESEIFVGSVWCELRRISFTDPPPPIADVK